MSTKGRCKGFLPALLGAGLLVAQAIIPISVAAREKLPETAQDLRYGVILYNYFQHDYLGALSELQVAQQRGGIQGHGRHPVILEGAMSLAFGMDRTATGIFQQALAIEGSGEVRNAAWFYLARMRFRKGDWSGAMASLSYIEGDVDNAMADELRAMKVDLAIRTKQLDKAQVVLEEKGDAGDWQPYLYYNLGTAHIRARDINLGIDYLDQLSALELQSEEHWSLQDKGLIAAGFSLMGEGHYSAAVERFSKVRLESSLAEQALLGYGWSSVQLGDFSKALGPWQILAGRSPLRPAVQEALLAVPYAYEKLGSLGSALQEFEAAEQVFSYEIARLERLKETLEPGDLVAAIELAEQQGDSPGGIDPELLGIVELLSGDRFALYRTDIRDLHALRERLDYWQRNIGVYAAMLEQRKERRKLLLAGMHDDEYYLRLQEMTVQRDLLAAQLVDTNSEKGIWSIADDQTRALWSRVERAQARLARLRDAGEDVAKEAEMLKRYRGLILWQASQRWHEWHWQATKRLRQLDAALDESQRNLHRVAGVIAEVPDIAPFEQRLANLEYRLQVQVGAVERNFLASETALQATLVAELGRQQERLRHYQSQARLAKARLYDRAHLEMPQ